MITVEADGARFPRDAEAWGDLAPHWVRSYTGVDGQFVFALFQSDGIDMDALEARALENGWTLHRTVEIRPGDYLGAQIVH